MNDFYQLDATQQAARLTHLAKSALHRWNVQECDPVLIKFRENAVFKVRDSDGNPTVLRVHRQGYHSNESLASELRWMAMLRESGMQVPYPLPAVITNVKTDEKTEAVKEVVTEQAKAETTNPKAANPEALKPAAAEDGCGEYLVIASCDQTPGNWQVDMLSWMDGKELGEVGEPLPLAEHGIITQADSSRGVASLFENIGATMATLHNLSCNWSGTPGMQRHAWDHDGLVGDNPLWGEFWQLEALDSGQRKKILEIKSAVSDGLKAYGRSEANYGLIHADMVPENVMIHGKKIQLIDFDDAGFGWHMFEIATALHWLTEEPEFQTMRSSLLNGYQRVRPLSDDDIKALPLFHVARSLTYLGWVHTRSHTQTAVEMTPIMIDIAIGLGDEYLV